MNISQSLLDRTYKEFKKRFEGVKEDYFGPLFISRKHDRPLEVAFENCVFGNNDYGIDGYYLDKEAKNLYLYQFKWSNSYELFKDSYKRLIDFGMERIFGNPLQDSSSNQNVNNLKYVLNEYSEIINSVYVRFVFNGDIEKAQQSKALENFREDLEAKKYLLDQYFGERSIQFIIEYLSNDTSTVVQASKTRKTHKYNISFTNTGVIEAPNGEKFYLGFISLNDLRIMYDEMGLRLFEKNIRAGLDADRAPNRAIKKALRDIVIDETLHPEYFSFNHNGVTIYVEEIDINNDTTSVVEPRILNGAQTIATLARFVSDNSNHPALEENMRRLKSIQVMAKVITNCSPDFIASVTIANNRQNPVDPINLRATDGMQFELEDKFRDQVAIYYERQEKAFESLTDSDLEELGIYEHREITIKKLAQTFLAMQGEVDRISRLAEVFENDNFYRSTFRPEYLKVSSELIVLLYKVHFRVNSVIKEIIEKGANKYWWANKAKNLIWALLIQGILNDAELEELVENHGRGLSVASNYNDYLKGIGSKRIRFVLAELTQQKKYAEAMEQEKYGFFRAKVSYQEAMQIAKRKYGWEKKGIMNAFS